MEFQLGKKSWKLWQFNSLNVSVVISIITTLLALYSKSLGSISWDNFGMYCYLPSFFIDGTFHQGLEHFEKLNQLYDFSSTLYQFNVLDGIAFTKYTCGLALLISPFFLFGHLFAYLLGFPMDGYSEPYSIAFAVGSLFYVIVGIFILRRLLLYFFEDRWVAWAMIFVIFGTNLLLSTLYSGSNILAFVSVTAMLLCTVRFHEKINVLNGILLGSSLAILGLIRLPDLILGLIPVFWNVNQYGSIIKKIKHFFTVERSATLSALLSFFVIISLQLFYWKNVSGHYFIDSYANNPGEGFDWSHPHTIPFLLSFKKGWLIYTPLAIIALIGLFKMWKRKGNDRLLVLVFILFVYVASTWTTWWYAGSFSSRAMLDIYVILAIAITVLLQNTKLRKIILIFGCLFVILNLLQSWQYKNRIISSSQMTAKYYFSTFGQLSPPSEQQLLLLEPNYFDYADLSFKDMKLKKLHTWNVIQKRQVLDSTNFYTQDNPFSIKEYFKPFHLYLAQAIWKYDPENFNGMNGFIPNMSMTYKGNAYGWRGGFEGTNQIEIDTVKHEIKMLYLIPDLRTSSDILRVQIWNQSEKGYLKVDNLTLNLYLIEGRK